MFRRLLSNLPFNPSLINQVSFYAKRVHQEEGVRRSGMVMMVLALLMQLFAVVTPPQQSFATPGNDVIPGGFSQKATAMEYCERNAYNFRHILNRFDIDCGNLNASTTRTIRSTDYNRKLLSLGRVPYQKPGERPITGILGEASPLYMRYLWGWDSGLYSSYKALVGTNTKGQPFMVLYNCGNVVIVDTPEIAPPIPPATPAAAPKNPKPEIVNKTTLPGTPQANAEVKPGTVLGYRIFFRNTGDAAATNVFVEDSIPEHTTFVNGSQGSGKANRYDYTNSVYPGHGKEPHVYWAYNSFPAGATGYYVDFRVKIDSNVEDDTRICNRAYIRSNQTPQTSSNRICHVVAVTPVVVAQPTPEVQLPPPTVVATPVKPCVASQDVNDTTSCLELHKTAHNNTKNIDANGTTAAAGDVITYTLTTKNTGSVAADNYVIQENMIDVMEYAVGITDLDGGTLGNDKIVRWPALTIQPGQTITKKLTIKVKPVIPQTPTPPSNPGSFDLMMTNVYGDAVNIRLPGSVATVVAHTNTTLPRTGPGTTVTIAVLVTFMAAYFFGRSRLMGKELDLVREEFAASGGY